MKTLDISKAQRLLDLFATDPGQNPVILTHKGKPVAVLMPTGGADVETISLSLNPKFRQIMERSAKSYYQQGGIPFEEVRRQLGIPSSGDSTKSKRRKPAGSNHKRKDAG